MENKKISVIVPVYNVAQYLEKCLNSIINQTYQNLEIILVDDGSTDASPELCDIYAKKDKRIRVIHKKNGGLSDARNVGIDSATGEYLAFVDSDDWIDITMFEKMVKKIEVSNSDIVLCNVMLCFENGEEKDVEGKLINEKKMSVTDVIHELCKINTIPFVVAWNKLYKREVFSEIRYPRGYLHEDEAVIHRIYGNCASIYVMKEAFYYYRQRRQSIMGKGFSVKKIDVLGAWADRIIYSRKKKWADLKEKTISEFDDLLWKIIDEIPDFYKDKKYNGRLKKSVRKVIIPMVKSKKIVMGHKFYMILLAIGSRNYIFVRKIIQKIK